MFFHKFCFLLSHIERLMIILHFKQYDMFYNGSVLYMKSVGLILSQALFLLGFCFTNIEFLATQLAHFRTCLFTLFDVITFFVALIISLNVFIMTAVVSWQHSLKALVSCEWFYLNSNCYSLFKILSIKKLLRLLFDASAFFIYGFKNIIIFLIRINSNKITTKFFFIAFWLSISQLISLPSWSYSSTSVAILKLWK